MRDWVYSLGEPRGTRVTASYDGKFLQDVHYQPFGVATSNGAQPGSQLYTPEQWNGGDALAGFGLSNLGARLYDPVLGRFLSRDPLLILRSAATSNPYAFAANDPINHTDPTGRDWQDGCIGVECQWLHWQNPFDLGGGGGFGGGGGGRNDQEGGGTPAPPRRTRPPMTGMNGSACEFADGSGGCNDAMWPTFTNPGFWHTVGHGIGTGARAFGHAWNWTMDRVDRGLHRAAAFVEDHAPYIAAGATFVTVMVFEPEVVVVDLIATGGATIRGMFAAEEPAIVESGAAAGEDAVIVEEAVAAEAEAATAAEGGPITPLGRGSTADGVGRWLPRNLREQLAVEEAMQNPGAGEPAAGPLGDPRWPASDGWVKLQQEVDPGGRGGPITVHYNLNTVTGEVDDFKIVWRRPFIPPKEPSVPPIGP